MGEEDWLGGSSRPRTWCCLSVFSLIGVSPFLFVLSASLGYPGIIHPTSFEQTFRIFIQAQIEQNNMLNKITENHKSSIGKLSNQTIAIRNDVQDLQERTKTVDARLGKVVESQALILAKFAGKPEPNPVEDLKMMRVVTNEEKPEELDYSNASTPEYNMEDLLKMITVKNPGIEQGNDDMYQQFIQQVASKVRDLGMEYKRLADKLPTKLDDIFESTIKIKLGVNEISALCDLGASVLTISKSLFDKLNFGPFVTTELRLHLANSTYKQAVGIKGNLVVEIKVSPALIDLVLVDMPEDPIGPIILGRPFLRTIKALINLHKGNVRIGLPSRDLFVVHFPREKKANPKDDDDVITLKANYFGVGVPLHNPK
uniref:Uncharacterized protein n=1 Tax=Avena sativa TaxID=4498 RepID=A0ACD5UN64_AVESA